jgi:2-methylisocitrate lyase-like PEP mutase family enzyme
MASQQNACLEFRRLHETGCFVIPNPWDEGSARVLTQLGFRALATTSAGFAWCQGRADHHITLTEALEHFCSIAATVDVPVSADFAAAFAVEPEKVADNVAAAAATGIAGLSVEDGSRQSDRPLFQFDLAVERVRAARRAIDAGSAPLVLTARSEGFVVGRPDLAETIRRLTAFADAGADCVYAPGIRTNEITAIVSAVSPTPVNVGVGSDFTTVAELAALGVRRISVGGALARAAWTGFLQAATEIAERGTFSALGRAVSGADINGRF